MKARHILLSVSFLAIGFMAGTAWKSADTTAQERQAAAQPREVAPVKIVSNTEQATIDLFEEAAPSVVFITSISLRRSLWNSNIQEVPRGSGSGFIWDDQGHIVTNFHVIRGSERVQVTLSDQTTLAAERVGVAPEKDLAVIKVDAPAEKLRPLAIGRSSDLKVGQFVYAIGNPFGLDQTLTTGVISALGREIESVTRIPIRDVIQTDAAINPGNSGGPLLDSSGRLIGVNTQIYSPSGASAGIGFSIPVDVVGWAVPDLIKYGEIRRAVLGVELVATSTTSRLGISGALIMTVTDGGAAEKAGLRSTQRNRQGEIELGDVIVGVGDEEVSSNSDLILALEEYNPGDVVTLRILRDEEPLEVEVTLGGS